MSQAKEKPETRDTRNHILMLTVGFNLYSAEHLFPFIEVRKILHIGSRGQLTYFPR